MSRTKQTDPKPIRAARRLATAPAKLRVIERAPRPGFFHPASRKDVLHFLTELGPTGAYGLKEIELRRAPSGKHLFLFGRYEAPSKICLFEQETSPWPWPADLPARAVRLLRLNGAHFDRATRTIAWPEQTLRDFMLRHVLLHELGHHHLQHYEGKRAEPRARIRDHEAFARLHAQRERKRVA